MDLNSFSLPFKYVFYPEITDQQCELAQSKFFDDMHIEWEGERNSATQSTEKIVN